MIKAFFYGALGGAIAWLVFVLLRIILYNLLVRPLLWLTNQNEEKWRRLEQKKAERERQEETRKWKEKWEAQPWMKDLRAWEKKHGLEKEWWKEYEAEPEEFFRVKLHPGTEEALAMLERNRDAKLQRMRKGF